MKIENLKEGMVIKNYKELCRYLEWNTTTGNAKKSQFKDLERYCKYHKEGQKIVVDEVFETPLPSNSQSGRPTSIISEFCIDEDKFNNGGVYIIQLDNEIYIGSTVNFRQRFNAHRSKSNTKLPQTRDLIERGGQMSILHDMTDIEDIELIRMVEEEYILFFTHETDYDVVNRRIGTFAFEKPKKPKIKYKSIKIEENRLSEVLEILEERGVHYKYR